jgi:hypothetical protein
LAEIFNKIQIRITEDGDTAARQELPEASIFVPVPNIEARRSEL